MVWERNNIKKWRSSWTKTLVPSLELPSIRRPLSQVFNYPRGKDLFTLNVLFSQCGSFFSTLDNVFFQISSCENSKEQTWKLKIHSIMSQFTTLNVRAILSVSNSATFCVLFSTFLLMLPTIVHLPWPPPSGRCREIAVVERWSLVEARL